MNFNLFFSLKTFPGSLFQFKTILIIVILVSSFLIKAEEPGLGKHAPLKPDVCRFVVESKEKHQTIDNFGASDGWSMQYIGLWPEEKQKKMADWLFSTENDKNGNPKGIGLSLWRFNIGAGSTEQGKASGINDVWRRAECFLLPDGTYDWNKQKGQRNFLQLAKLRGVDQFYMPRKIQNATISSVCYNNESKICNSESEIFDLWRLLQI